jgi:septal ring factor EnvC (AmiA/AmiB activator)
METKKDLEEKIAELEAKLNEQKHLADAVNAKDEEISKIKEEIIKLKEEYSKINNQLTEKNLKIQALEKEKAARSSMEEKENTVKKLIHALQGYQNAYRSFLKNVQGGLENAVELEALLSEQLK